jgi:hypothetical protein
VEALTSSAAGTARLTLPSGRGSAPAVTESQSTLKEF